MNFMSLKKVVFFLVQGVFTVNVMLKKKKDPQVLLFLFLSLPVDICFTLPKGDQYCCWYPSGEGLHGTFTTRRVSSQAPEILFLLEISLCPGGVL